MDMSEFQGGAACTQIKDYVLEHIGLKVSSLHTSQMKWKCGIEVGKNYNLPKSEDSKQPQGPPENEIADNLYQRSELDWLIYNNPIGCADLILHGEPKTYLKAAAQYKRLK